MNLYLFIYSSVHPSTIYPLTYSTLSPTTYPPRREPRTSSNARRGRGTPEGDVLRSPRRGAGGSLRGLGATTALRWQWVEVMGTDWDLSGIYAHAHSHMYVQYVYTQTRTNTPLPPHTHSRTHTHGILLLGWTDERQDLLIFV